jgi:hypothetical protein
MFHVLLSLSEFAKKENAKMIRIAIFSIALAVLICNIAAAQDSGFGLGFILGEPTGLSGKLWITKSVSLNGGLAWSFRDEEALHLHTDGVFHNFRGVVRTYYGIGWRIKFADQVDAEGERKVGIRVPVGVTYLFAHSPWDIFIEILPVIDLAPETETDINGAIGIRYYFGSHGIEPELEEDLRFPGELF